MCIRDRPNRLEKQEWRNEKPECNPKYEDVYKRQHQDWTKNGNSIYCHHKPMVTLITYFLMRSQCSHVYIRPCYFSVTTLLTFKWDCYLSGALFTCVFLLGMFCREHSFCFCKRRQIVMKAVWTFFIKIRITVWYNLVKMKLQETLLTIPGRLIKYY